MSANVRSVASDGIECIVRRFELDLNFVQGKERKLESDSKILVSS